MAFFTRELASLHTPRRFGALPLLFAGLLGCDASAERPNPCHCAETWAKNFGERGYDGGATAVARFPDGDLVVVGGFEHYIDLGGGDLVSSGVMGSSGFLARFDSCGNHRYSLESADSFPSAVAVGPDGDIVLLSSGYVVSKLRGTSGAELWRFTHESLHPITWSNVGLTSDGGVVLAGVFRSEIQFDGGGLEVDGYTEAGFVARLDAAGHHVWSRRFGTPTSSNGGGLATPAGIQLDADGAIVVVGNLRSQGSMDFGGGLLSPTGAWELVAAKFGPDGAHRWSKRFAGTQFGDIRASAVELDPPTGDIVVAGQMNSENHPVDFGGGPLEPIGGEDGFLVKLGPDGAHRWSKRFPSTQPKIAIGALGRILLAGDMSDVPMSFGGDPLQPEPGSFLALFEPGGAHVASAAQPSVRIDGIRAQPSGDWTAFGMTVQGGGKPRIEGALISAGGFVSVLDRGLQAVGAISSGPVTLQDVVTEDRGGVVGVGMVSGPTRVGACTLDAGPDDDALLLRWAP